ncbi:aromatic compound catabolic protein [Carnobacterium maltaromaticum]|uniref:PaaI family thioesterase n=1 Tax=Carnobacterium maltaromaticum TaxID=2751 RepID=UPI000C7919ED|nr:PaaI family thioesterase [Carnobacterium maltaromaticum]PLS34426.1 aromatic compound catabolic protein [Carnobacterium maltaromaticum]PLS34931.1 aromatic compound catabolic protein [Carnobacterium maltaromaticum]PLS35344.1 aromatic compound catabolic protein [Carnobacterium maltaromaticum]PLS41898.1 aromatic compound catabolic protein [Carnobacterium maltaromaticum]PLS44733.1 aromatic compound catabolic protein [Carnobacterium maltaromaticum]
MTLMDHLGIHYKNISKDSVELELTIEEQHKQPYGIMHGGISAVLAETAASLGANAQLDTTKEVAVGLELNLNHLRAVPNGTIIAVAMPLHIGKKTQVWEIKITNERKKLVSAGRCTLFIQEL